MKTSLPAIDTSERLIHGAVLKCVDGRWSTADEGDLTGASMLVLHVTRAAQHWHDKKPVQTIVEDHGELPDIEKLNFHKMSGKWDATATRGRHGSCNASRICSPQTTLPCSRS
jgi:hypothetical protein